MASMKDFYRGETATPEGVVSPPEKSCKRRKYKSYDTASSASFMIGKKMRKEMAAPEYCTTCKAHHTRVR